MGRLNGQRHGGPTSGTRAQAHTANLWHAPGEGCLQSIQEEEGLKFANKLSKGHVKYHRHKMNVKIAAQTLSSSVADALEFLMNAGHPNLQDAAGTIKFLRVIDKIFDLLNSRSVFGKGYKRPLCLADRGRWTSTIDQTIEYFKGMNEVFSILSPFFIISTEFSIQLVNSMTFFKMLHHAMFPAHSIILTFYN